MKASPRENMPARFTRHLMVAAG